jgi:hypothetical protein
VILQDSRTACSHVPRDEAQKNRLVYRVSTDARSCPFREVGYLTMIISNLRSIHATQTILCIHAEQIHNTNQSFRSLKKCSIINPCRLQQVRSEDVTIQAGVNIISAIVTPEKTRRGSN